MEDLARYLSEIVDPTVKDFERDPTSVRHAFLACVAVFHSVDYLAFPRSSRGVRQEFNNQSQEFAVVDRVAHAFKHVSTGRPSERFKASDVISRPPAAWDVAGAWDLSRWDDSVGGVTLDSDRSVDLLEVIRDAVTFLRLKTSDK
jgi:hypothetical protein